MRYAPFIVAVLAGLALAFAGVAGLGMGAVYGGTLLAILGACFAFDRFDGRRYGSS